MPPLAGGIIEPLKGKGQLTVGHGNSGWPPYEFILREGQNVDVGVIKLFLSRTQVNLSDVAQSSPFLASVPGPVGGHSTAPPPPSVPTGGPSTSSTTTSLPSDAGFVSRASEAAKLKIETSDPNTLPFPWDTVEIIVVQQREKKKKKKKKKKNV